MRNLLACVGVFVFAAACGDDGSSGSGGNLGGGGATNGGAGGVGGGTGGTGATGGSGSGGETCAAATSVTDPSPEERVSVASHTFATSPFEGAGVFVGTEFEVWDLTSEGELNRLVWFAGVSDTTAMAEEGVLAAGEAWEVDHHYGVRARHVSSECAEAAWSPVVPFFSDDPSAFVFDEDVVRDLYLDLPPDTYAAINAQAFPPDCVPFERDYHTGTLTYDGQVFEGVGVRLKGGCGSSRSLEQKASFKVKVDWNDPDIAGCPEERRLFGLKGLTLNNGVQDQTAMHEKFAYQFMREMGLPVPRMAHVQVHVATQPGGPYELYGLYQVVENIDRSFLKRNYDSNDGMLYEATYWCDIVPGSLPPDESDTACLAREFTPGECSDPNPDQDPMDYSLVRDMILSVDALTPENFYVGIQEIFDFDQVLTLWAAEAVLGHWDGYNYWVVNNYRLYHDPSTGLWSIIDTGVDQTFVQQLDPWGATALLANRCLADAACQAALAEKVRLARDVFEAMDLSARVDAAAELLGPYVEADPRREYDLGTWAVSVANMKDFIASRPAAMDAALENAGFDP